jgi:integrase
MADYVRTKTPGVYVRHELACPASDRPDARCRCKPSYRARRRDRGWSETFKSKDQAIEWKSSAVARAAVVKEAKDSPTFGVVAREWWDGVESGAISKRKGRKDQGYSDTTLPGYRRSLFNKLLPEFENEPAAGLDESRWQAWVDRESRNGLSRSRLANHIAVVSAIYGWASRPTRRIVPRNPTLTVELPPNDETPRERVATADEAARLLDALEPDDQVPYALAFYAGLRRSEIHRLEEDDVDLDSLSLIVRRAKSDAGTERRIPIAAPLKPILEAARERRKQRRSPSRRVCHRSVMSGKLVEAAYKAWGWKRQPPEKGKPQKKGEPGEWIPAVKQPLEPIGLHECRHTYASLLVAAHYTLKEVMEYMGHADLTTTSRYVKRLPQPSEDNPADRLNAYLAAA